MQSLHLEGIILAPIATATLASLVGIKLAYWRIYGRNPAWSILDAIILLPALLPAKPLAIVMQDLFGRWLPEPGFWPIIATLIVSLPFAYLPCRIAFARIDRESLAASQGLGTFARAFRIFIPAAWPAILISIFLATARIFRIYASEILAPAPAVILVAIPSIAAAFLIARELRHPRSKP